MLEEACRLHTNGQREADVTIQTCWDADRLDLLRVGTHPVTGIVVHGDCPRPRGDCLGE